ncbi:MAG TPA: DNA-3-methyladenine glycosylase [Pirellulales bacterium]|jgi:DNA-3-methyladenine glycosylase|nr:DNA-3-methyladenine glycosylase [Pirellulales bacterium]
MLAEDFFARETLVVARELIGTELVVGRCAGRIVETEAYKTDAASHYVTRRNQAVFMRETHAHVYVYFIYGMYHCLNFTTDSTAPGAILIRAAEPLRGIELMRQRRRTTDIRKLARGPGCLCQAFAIDLSFNGLPIGKKIRVLPRRDKPAIETTRRIGISQAVELPWRFYERDSQFTSPHPRE